MILACTIAIIVTVAAYLGAFFLFRSMEHFKKYNSSTGKKEVNMGMVALYAGFVAAPVAILTLIGCIMWVKRGSGYKMDWSNIGRHGKGNPADVQIQNMSRCLGINKEELKKIHAGPKFARLVQECQRRNYQPLDTFETSLKQGLPRLDEVF